MKIYLVMIGRDYAGYDCPDAAFASYEQAYAYCKREKRAGRGGDTQDIIELEVERSCPETGGLCPVAKGKKRCECP